MPVLMPCPHCAKQFGIPDDLQGKQAECPHCSKQFLAPSSRQISAAPLPPARPSRPAPLKTVLEITKQEIECPSCRCKVGYRVEHVGRMVACPQCTRPFMIPDLEQNPPPLPPRPSAPPGAALPFAYPDSALSPMVKEPEGKGGTVCCILSCVFGGIAFLLCPPLFGLAGLILGIIGVCLAKNKTPGIVGIVLSVVGAIAGMFLGAAMMGGRSHF